MGASAFKADNGGALDSVGDEELVRNALAVLRQRPGLKDSLLKHIAAPLDFEELVSGAPEDLSKAGGIIVLVQSSWAAPHIHCREGPQAAWTSPPGLPLGPSSVAGFTTGWFAIKFPASKALEFLVNDGKPQEWIKSPDNSNFQITTVGLWTLRGNRLSLWDAAAPAAEAAAPPAAAAAAVEALACSGVSAQALASQAGVSLFYKTPWSRPHLHCNLGAGLPWTQAPGVPMQASALQEGMLASQGWFGLRLPTASRLEFLLNDGGSQWDKAPGGGNYSVGGPGVWRLMNGRVEDATAAPAAAPAPAEVAPSELEPALTAASLADLPAKDLAGQAEPKGVVIFYRTAWPSPHIHCRPNATTSWTALPGLAMRKTSAQVESDLKVGIGGGEFGASWYAISLPEVESLEFLFNDGGPHYRWDKGAGGGNHNISKSAAWILQAGRLEKLQGPLAAPVKPLAKDSTHTTVTLSWTPPAGEVRCYRIFRDGKELATTQGAVAQFTDTGLLADRSFKYEVAAISGHGCVGTKSALVEAKTLPPTKPGKPIGLRCAAANGKKIELEWSLPEDTGGAPVTAFSVSRNGKVIQTVLAGAESTVKWVDQSVKSGESYQYVVAACHLPLDAKLKETVLQDKKAKAPAEHELLSKLPASVNEGAPAGPLEAQAMDELETGVCVANIKDQLAKSGVTLFYKSGWTKTSMHCRPARATATWTPLPGLPMVASPSPTFPAEDGWVVVYLPYAKSLDLVLTDGSDHWDKAPGGSNYKIAVPQVARIVDGQMERVAAPPGQPTGLTAEATDGSRIQLAWSPPAVAKDELPVVGYKVLRNGKCIKTIMNGDASECHCIDMNLFAATDYEYCVSAVNHQQAVGDMSASVTARTGKPGIPSAPRTLRCSISKQEEKVQIKLEWEPPADCGGAPVASYEILRDGLVIGVFDVDIEQLKSETEAAQPVQASGMERRWVRHTASYSSLSWFTNALEWVDTTAKMGETYTYQVSALQLGPDRGDELRTMQRCGSRLLDEIKMDVRGPACDPVEIKAVPFLDPPRIGERYPRIVFQAFDWDSHKDPNWYGTLLGMLPELRSAGVNMFWLAPVSDSVDRHGYLPKRWYRLDSNYGSAGDLQKLVLEMHQQGVVPMLDVVVNHRCAAAQDSAGRWLKFEEPNWEGWAICRNSPAVPGGTGAEATGELAQYAPSVDHTNPKVRQDVKDWISHMMNEVGFRALRFDMAKGYAPHFQAEYVKSAGAPFAMAEYWEGGTDGLHGYVQQCQGVMSVCDFPLYYVLKRSIHTNNFSDMRGCDGKMAGIAGRDPCRSVTFVENHDTVHLAVVGGAFGNNEQVLRGYAIILTHPGTPCVFYGDYARGSHVREKLLQLCSIRRDAGIHSTSGLWIVEARGGLYAAVIDGKVAVKIGTDDWSPGGGWNVATWGHEFCVWTK
eukprot:TRINITY_DN49365_c0_g1_i1.p1 TRINITY_DN49365_c0_g1~~TRINITY_DN49365_c0_g1_i1.p1  ORF type:complete len:1423 (-),score=374.72 TRINITY_DN49365_c0_g1_i1:178-4446(-)